MVNIELLDRVIAQIEARPELWDQAQWAAKTECGTSHCIAGWAVHLTHPEAAPDWSSWRLVYESGTTGAVRLAESGMYDVMPYSTAAQACLGLTARQAQVLFYIGQEIEKIKEIRDLLAVDPNDELEGFGSMEGGWDDD